MIKAIHSHLGPVTITSNCIAMQLMNFDNTSLFVEHDDEIKEVSKDLVNIPVMCNGFPGIIVKIHNEKLKGMVDVKLDSGITTVAISDVEFI